MGISSPQPPTLTPTTCYQTSTSLLYEILSIATSVLYLRSSILSYLFGFLPILSRPLYRSTTVIQKLISNTTRVPTLQLYILSQVLLSQTYRYVSVYATTLALQGYYACRMVAKEGVKLGKEGVKYAWKKSEGLRNKLFFELAVFVLGNGNGIVLILFWPGWIIIGLLVCVGRFFIGG